MKNVMTGFQVSKKGMPKLQVVKMNKEFKARHSYAVPKPPKASLPKKAPKLPNKKSWGF